VEGEAIEEYSRVLDKRQGALLAVLLEMRDAA
jgi:hypothetical protein